MENNQKIQVIKNLIVNRAFNKNFGNDVAWELTDEAETIIDYVANKPYGLATEIAHTVNKFKKVSEKQAYWIAKAAVENNECLRVEYLFN
jgi:hypothetical protein